MLEQMVTLGYWVGAAGVVLCIIGYFIFPAMMQFLLSGENNEE